ncbi:hypothetical protein ACWGI9_42660 [Streptomyces sp. NPDC054833]
MAVTIHRPCHRSAFAVATYRSGWAVGSGITFLAFVSYVSYFDRSTQSDSVAFGVFAVMSRAVTFAS